jgi:hypothetical protein
MHLRHQVVLTTIEEDFRKIGILTEGDDSKAKVKDEEEDEDPADGKDGDKPAFLKKKMAAAEKKEKKEGAALSPDEGLEDLDEVKRIRKKRASSGQKRKWKMAKRKGKAKQASKKYRKRSSVKRMLKIHKRRAARMRHGKPAGRTRLTFGNDNVSNMLEQVQEIVEGLDTERAEHSVKAFANIAIIAEMLARAFSKFAKESEDTEHSESLSEAAEFFSDMAEEAADVAKTLSEGPDEDEEFDLDVLGEEFQAQMSDLLNGLEMYADITEDEDLAEMADDDDDDDDAAEEEDDDVEEEDEEPEAEAPKKNPFVKKTEKKGK